MRDRRGVVAGLLGLAFALLLLVGVAGPSAAKAPLGPRGWAPGELAWAPSAAVVTALVWAAYLVGAAGVLVHLRSRPLRTGWAVPAGLGLMALLTGPFGSPDHTVYAAYGRIAATGGDAYLTPADVALAGDPMLRWVDAPWQHTVSVYGPVATALHALAAWVGGDSMRQTVWVWQVVVVLAWLAVRWLLLRAGVDRGRVDALWTLNPLVFGIGVLGAHVDLVAAALALAALVWAARNPWVPGLFTGLAASTKVTYAVVLLAIPLAWWAAGPPASPAATPSTTGGRVRGWWLAAYLAVVAVVVGVAHGWAGTHVFDQLDRARSSVSFAMPWRLLLEALRGPLSDHAARTVVSVGGIVVALLLVVVLARLTRSLAPPTVLGTAARWSLVLTTAYAFAAPYSLPWYDLLTWATLPVLAASVLDRVVLARLLVMVLAYVPGRVTGMTATVQDLTLWVRRRVAPLAQLVVWGWLTLAAVRGSRRPSAPPPPAPARRPR